MPKYTCKAEVWTVGTRQAWYYFTNICLHLSPSFSWHFMCFWIQRFICQCIGLGFLGGKKVQVNFWLRRFQSRVEGTNQSRAQRQRFCPLSVHELFIILWSTTALGFFVCFFFWISWKKNGVVPLDSPHITHFRTYHSQSVCWILAHGLLDEWNYKIK